MDVISKIFDNVITLNCIGLELMGKAQCEVSSLSIAFSPGAPPGNERIECRNDYAAGSASDDTGNLRIIEHPLIFGLKG